MSRVGSNLATITTLKTTQCNIPRNKPITKITIHHAAGVISGANLQGWGRSPSCGASWHYGIGNDGVIGQLIDERNRPWTSSSAANDHQAITIEVSNSVSGGEWPVGEKAFNALLDLCTDICKRNGISKLVFDGTPNGSLTHHSMFAKTSCPGKYLLDRFPQICAEVNKRLGTVSAPATPTTHTPKPTPSTDFKVGDIVQFTGGGVYVSSTTHIPAHSRDRSRCKVTQTAPKARNQYHLVSEDSGKVWGWVVSEDVAAIVAAPTPAPVFAPYLVRVQAMLNIRKGPGTNHAVVGTIKDNGVYTITEESGTWGRLKSGAGWVSLQYCVRV